MKKKIFDLQEKQNQMIKQKEEAIEKELMNQMMEDNIYNKKNNNNKNIEDMYFNSETAVFYECGICMDIFKEKEQIRKLYFADIFFIKNVLIKGLIHKKLVLYVDN